MSNQNLTGYPSIDKPWLKYYSEESIHAPLPKCSAYDFVYQNNRDYLNDTAINYYGRKITYGDMFEQIERTAKAFYEVGVRKGDIVIVCSVNMPETVYTLYGLNRLGAIVNLTDPRSNPEAMREYINECNAKLVVTVDLAYPLIKKAVVDSTVDKIILISPSDSLPPVMKFLYRLKNKSPEIRAVDSCWNDFIKGGNDITPEYAEYQQEEPFVMAHTGGTTGVSKTVVLSDDNLNAVAHGYARFLGPIKREQRLFNDLPPFIIYGLSFATHAALCCGLEVILYPVFDSKGFPKQFLKYKPNIFSALPDHFKYLCANSKVRKMDLSFLVTAAVGGDSMDEKLERETNNFLKERGCESDVCKGYGMSELGSGAVTSMNYVNEIGSVGIPLVNNIIKVVDTDSLKELQYNQVGEIWISGPSLMLEYYKNPEATAETIVTDHNGVRWIRTGDLGHITEDGLLYHEGRIRRIYLTDFENQPAKIFPMIVEDKIKENENVYSCCVVGRKRKDSACYEAVAYILKEAEAISTETEITNQLIFACEESLATYMRPVEYRYIDELPHTPIGKVDFRKLEEMATETN